MVTIQDPTADFATVVQRRRQSRAIPTAVDRTFPLSEAEAAIRYMIEGHARGKVVITV